MKTDVPRGEEVREERRDHVIQPDDQEHGPDLGLNEIAVEQCGFVVRTESDNEQPAK